MEPQIEQIIALNMVGDPDYLRMKYPVAIAFVVALSPLKIAWFALPDTQLARAEHRGGPRDFKYTNVNLTWDKEWIKHNWWKSKKKRPTVSQIMEAWKMDDARKEWVLPVAIPQPAPDEIKAKDKFKVTMKWVQDTLIPACVDAGCVH